MTKVSQCFVKMSLTYLAVAVCFGIAMVVHPEFRVTIRYAHIHLMFLGWMNMMIFGVAYHILPRFMGNPLWSPKLSWWHFWTGNIGLVGLITAETIFANTPSLTDGTLAISVTAAFGVVEAVSIGLFIFNIWKSMNEAPPAENPFFSPAGNPASAQDRLHTP